MERLKEASIQVLKSKCRACGEEFEAKRTTMAYGMSFTQRLCQSCQKRGTEIYLEDEANEIRAECRGRVRAKRDAIFKRVGKKYSLKSFSNFSPGNQSQEKALTVSKKFAEEIKGWLFLYGPAGVGKTHLAVGILNKIWPYKPVFYPVAELLLHLRSSLREKTEEEAIEPFKNAPILILDDLGVEKITDWVRQAFYVIIAHRERNELPTIFTSNLSLDELEERIGDDRITSRIAGSARIVKIEGADYRLKEKRT